MCEPHGQNREQFFCYNISLQILTWYMRYIFTKSRKWWASWWRVCYQQGLVYTQIWKIWNLTSCRSTYVKISCNVNITSNFSFETGFYLQLRLHQQQCDKYVTTYRYRLWHDTCDIFSPSTGPSWYPNLENLKSHMLQVNIYQNILQSKHYVLF